MTETSTRGTNPAVPRIVPFAVFIVLMVVEPFLAAPLEPVLDPRWLYGIRSAVTVGLLLVFWRSYGELRDPPSTSGLWWPVAIVVGTFVFGFWIILDSPLLTMGGEPEGFDPRTGGQVDVGLAVTRLAGSALVVPVMEELFWRSFLMRWVHRPRFLQVDPRSVGLKAVLITSAIFAVEHRLWFAGLMAGLIYAELYRRSRSLWVVILAHAVTNGLLGWYVLATGNWEFW